MASASPFAVPALAVAIRAGLRFSARLRFNASMTSITGASEWRGQEFWM
jgi:hypothetical protein